MVEKFGNYKDERSYSGGLSSILAGAAFAASARSWIAIGRESDIDSSLRLIYLTPTSLKSPGETVVIRIKETSAGHVMVSAASASVNSLTGFGKSKENVMQFFKALDASIPALAPRS